MNFFTLKQWTCNCTNWVLFKNKHCTWDKCDDVFFVLQCLSHPPWMSSPRTQCWCAHLGGRVYEKTQGRGIRNLTFPRPSSTLRHNYGHDNSAFWCFLTKPKCRYYSKTSQVPLWFINNLYPVICMCWEYFL